MSEERHDTAPAGGDGGRGNEGAVSGGGAAATAAASAAGQAALSPRHSSRRRAIGRVFTTHRTATTVLVFALWSLLLAVPYFGLGPMSFVALHDTAEMNLPRAVWYGSSHALTGMGSWAPQGVSGTDRAAAGLARDLDTLLFTLLPGWLAYGLFMWLQRFIAGYFLYRLLREWRHVTPLAAGAVACAYALFTQPYINMAWTGFALYDGLALPGLPALCYLVFRSMRWRARYRYPALAAAGLALGFTSHFFLALFVVLVVVVLGVSVLPQGKVSRHAIWLGPLLFAAAWFAAEVPVIWAAAANAATSQRAGHALLAGDGQIAGGAGWLARFLLSNWLALALTALALVLGAWRRSWRVMALAGFVALTVALIAERAFLNSNVIAYLGPLSGFRFDRLLVVLPFLALLAGGAGLGLLPRHTEPSDLESGQRRRRIPVQALFGAAVLAVVVAQAGVVLGRIGGEMKDGASYQSLYGSPQLTRLAESQRATSPFRIANVNGPMQGGAPGAWHPGYSWAYGLETADGYSVLYSQRYRQFWERVIVAKMGTSQQMLEHFRAWGNRVYLFIYRRMLRYRGGVPAAERWNLSLLSLANVRYIVSPIALQDPSFVPVPDPDRDQQLKWARSPFLGRLKATAAGDFPGVPLFVYRNTQALPRAFVAGGARVYAGGAKVLDAMSQAPVRHLRGTAYLTRSDATTLALARRPLPARPVPAGTATVTSYQADEVALRSTSASRGVLILTDSYSRFWRAWVDGSEVQVAPVDHTFMGVALSAGVHRVVFKYQPPYGRLFWQ